MICADCERRFPDEANEYACRDCSHGPLCSESCRDDHERTCPAAIYAEMTERKFQEAREEVG